MEVSGSVAHSEDSVLGCKLGSVRLRHSSPGVFSEDADAEGWSDAAARAQGHSLDRIWQMRVIAGVFSASRLKVFVFS